MTIFLQSRPGSYLLSVWSEESSRYFFSERELKVGQITVSKLESDDLELDQLLSSGINYPLLVY